MTIIIEAPSGGRAVPEIPTRIALPRQAQSEIFAGWGVRFSK